MPSHIIHLAIASDILKKIKVNKKDFIFGNILPDTLNGYMISNVRKADHSLSHYTGNENISGGGYTFTKS